MEIRNLIAKVLGELHELKTAPHKHGYLVEELEFEISFVAKKSVGASGNSLWDLIIPVTVEGEYSTDKIQKVKIKLKPKENIRQSKKTTISSKKVK